MRDYKVQFVDDQAFDRLPGNDMGSKVGVAYPEYGQAFVRKSGSSLVDAFTMAHELEHMEGNNLNEHYDSENKCYYKGFAEVMQMIGPVLGGVMGGPPGAALGGMGSKLAWGQGGVAQKLGLPGAPKAPQVEQQQPNSMQMFQQPEETQMPNVIQAPGMGGDGGQGGIASPGTAAGNGPANRAADAMGYYQNRSPFGGF